MKQRHITPVQVEAVDGVAVVRLNRGVTNPIDLELVEGLAAHLVDLAGDTAVRSVVLTGASEKFFSIGFDIPALIDLPREEFVAFYRAFNSLTLDLYSFPKPSVAAIRGHAIAGGCILALCCDWRVMAEGRRLMGLNEVKLGVPIPFPADCILRSMLPGTLARDVMEIGEFYPPEDLRQNGLVDHVVAPELVVPSAVELAGRVAASRGPGYRRIKANRVEPVLDAIHARLEEREQHFLDCWYSDTARALLRSAAERF